VSWETSLIKAHISLIVYSEIIKHDQMKFIECNQKYVISHKLVNDIMFDLNFMYLGCTEENAILR